MTKLPLLLFTAHSVLTSRDRERSRHIASQSEKALTYQDLLAVKAEMTSAEVVAQLGKPPLRFQWNERRPVETGGVTLIPHEDYHYSDGADDLYVDLADGKVVGVHIHKGFNLSEDSIVFAGVFQFFYLRLAVFFGCLGIFMNLFRGEILDKSLHFYFLAPIRREVLMVGKFLAGLLATCVIFVTSEFLPGRWNVVPQSHSAGRRDPHLGRSKSVSTGLAQEIQRDLLPEIAVPRGHPQSAGHAAVDVTSDLQSRSGFYPRRDSWHRDCCAVGLVRFQLPGPSNGDQLHNRVTPLSAFTPAI